MAIQREGRREMPAEVGAIRAQLGMDSPGGGADSAGGGADSGSGGADSGGSGADTRGWGADSLLGIVARNSALGAPSRMGNARVVTLGWLPDIPDVRDLTLNQAEIRERLRKRDSLILRDAALPSRHDNIEFCSPVEDQGELGSCTAQAVVGLMEYMLRRRGLDELDGSRLFLYKATRNLMGSTGDTGAYVRTALRAVATFGVPPEQYYPYDLGRFDEEPSAFLYSFAANFKALSYTRLDAVAAGPREILDTVKRVLSAGYCVVCGFSVYSSISSKPDIPFPSRNDSLAGGHAVMVVGYDDDHMVGDTAVPSLIIRNSWGASWGIAGYGYLPYKYVVEGLALDFWTVFKWDWIDGQVFL